jgi:integrase
MLAKATPQMKAMILLGVNAALGNNDCATLKFRHVDLDGGWLDFPRIKTGIARRLPLWPETITALREYLAIRRTPKDRAHADLVFITAALGSFSKETSDSPISKEFAKLVIDLGIDQRGRGFYSLRHTFRTVADGAKDLAAARAIMGHADESMDGVYVETLPDDERLQAVAEHVRSWLYATPTKDGGATKGDGNAAAYKARRSLAAAEGSTRLRVVG